MSLICAISNEVPEQPVLSLVSGHVFEKRLILKYISEKGTDPIVNETLTEEQLVDIKNSSAHVKPRAPTATSIPALLKSLQDEWDATMLYSFTLRQQLQTARQELSHALYQHDAACRVIARLTKENVAAREALATLKPQQTSNTNGISVVPQTVYANETINTSTLASPTKHQQQQQQNIIEEGLTDEVVHKLTAKATELTTARKQKGKKQPEDLATLDDIKSFKCISSQSGLHSASSVGILSLDLQTKNPNKVVTGGVDKTVIVFNNSTERIEATLKGHTKKVTKCIYHSSEDIVVSGSADNTIKVWDVASTQCTYTFKFHDGNISGLSLHPVGDYLLSCSLDDHWAFSDIRTGRLYVKCASDAKAPTGGLTCAQFHPDGLIFGTGTSNSCVKIWDLKERTNVANFPGHTGALTSLAFSENGYYLATAAEDSCIKLWDLRKLKNFKTIQLDGNYEIKDLSFDLSGTYLACAGSDVRIYQVKQWDTLVTLTDHTATATGIRFGANAKTLVTSSMDRSIKFFGL